MADLARDGYTVVEQVVEPERVAALLAAMTDATGAALEDPASWESVPTWVPLWGHQAQWDVRQHPRIHDVFAQITGRRDLIVSQDGMSFKAPGGGSLPIHWDLSPRDPRRAYQGVLYLTDVTPDGGAFCGVPGIFRDLAGWLERHPDAGPADPEFPLDGHEIVPVPARAGDLVVFDSRLPHGNGANASDRPRVVQYVTMWPADFWGAGFAAEQAELYRTGMAGAPYRGRPGWAGPQPWPPAELTPLGRRLAGLDPWDGDGR